MFLNSNSGTINITAAILTFLIGLSISLAVAFFHHYYFPQKYVDEKASEISQVFVNSTDFPDTAKKLLGSRNDVAYLKLLDHNGVLEESFGNDDVGGTERYLLNAPDNKTVVLGMHEYGTTEVDSYALVWSLLIGTVMSFGLILFIFVQSPHQDKALKRLESAMERVAAGDLTARLDIDSSNDEEVGIMSAYQSFNRMVNILNRKFGNSTDPYPVQYGDESGETETSSDDTYEYSPFTSAEADSDDHAETEQDTDRENRQHEQSDYRYEEKADDQESDEDDKVVDFGDYEDHPEGEMSGESADEKSDDFRPRIVLPDTSKQPKKRNVTALVAKISDFEQLAQNLDSAELNSFLTSYRKAASTIIGDYGGVIEALLQDEIVALFNAPDEQNKPELRSVCAAVEVLHVLVKMSKDRRSQGRPLISGKIGIGLDTVSFSSGSGIPNSVKNIVSDAREICERCDEWKVQVSEELYDVIRDNVEVKQVDADGRTVYSVMGVEEGVIEL